MSIIRNRSFSGVAVLSLAALSFQAFCFQAFTAQSLSAQSVAVNVDRIHEAIDASHVVALQQKLRPEVRPVNDRGLLDSRKTIRGMRIVLEPSPEQSAALDQLLEAQRNPASPDYHNWLTPEQYGERFGASPNDLKRIHAWLEEQGFVIDQVARALNWITFDGTVSQIERAFHTEMHRYQADGQTYYSNSRVASVPAAFAGIVWEIRGLDDFHPKPAHVKQFEPDFNSASGAHYLAPDDLAAIYDITALYTAGFDGAGQKLAIAGQTDIQLSDLRGFRSYFNLPARDPQMVLFGSDPGMLANDRVEATLDLEWSGAVARNATIVYVYSQDVFESVQYIIDQDIAPVFSVSYGGCETGTPLSFRNLAQQANAEGITWMNASGDSGAAGCDYDAQIASGGLSPTFPANIPEVTAVGGTEFTESGTSGWNSQNTANGASVTGYLPETAWNDTPNGNGIWASGGGASTVFSKPSWQIGPGVPNDGARDVPDVALTASGDHDGYLIFASGGLMSVGGTSAASPSFAGIVTLLNHYLVSKNVQSKPGLGNINPTLYALANTTSGLIHDITTGNNVVPCAAGSTGCQTGSYGYQAGPGYDLVTGLGSVDAFKLVTGWATLPVPVGTTLSVAAAPASIASAGSTVLTATLTASTGSSAPTGSVAFSAGTTALGSATAVVSGTKSIATLTVKGSSLAAGNNTITASFTPAGNFSSASGSVTVSVISGPVTTATALAASPASVPSTGFTQLTATVSPVSGTVPPTGSVAFSAGKTVLGTVALNAQGASATAILNLTASKLAMGANSLTAAFTGTGNFTNSTSSAVVVTVTAPLISTSTLAAASPVSLAPTATTVVSATVHAASGNVLPTGSVTFTLGSVPLGSAALTTSASGATASLTIKGSSLSTGPNTIAASYGGSSAFAPSSSPLTITVVAPPATTTTVLSATPAILPQNGTTQLSAIVKAAAGSAVPTGSVTFSVGNTILGSAALTASSQGAVTSLNVKGSSLAIGANTVKAFYGGASSFATSSASLSVSVTASLVATTTTVAASPSTIAPGASSILTASIKAASGNTAPSGTLTFLTGSTTLGTAPLTVSGGVATATLTVKSTSLITGANSLSVNYSGSSAFAASSGTVTVVLSAATTSNVVATVTPAATSQPGFGVKMQLQEQAGVATKITGLTINGTDFSSVLSSLFGTTQLTAHGSLTASPIIQWNPLPGTLVFVFTGQDASGHQWSQSVLLVTKK